MRRQIILHYHLFKNAGSSVDRILRDSFGENWVNFDKEKPGARISALEMQRFIEEHPELKAISSHQVVPPVPQGDFEIFPVVFLRDPIDRVRSAWLFEWKKQLSLEEPKGSLSEYIVEKIKPRNGSVIADFHVSRLSNILYSDAPVSTSRHELDRLENAISFLRKLKFFGIVERFDESLQLMATHTQADFPEVKYKIYRENVTQDLSKTMTQKFDQMKKEIGEDLFREVLLRNRLDLQLYSYASGLFDARLENAGLITEHDNEPVVKSVSSM